MQIDRPITIALTLFIILLLVFFLVMPEYNTFVDLQTQLGEKKAEYNAEFDYYNAIAKTYSDLQDHKDDIKKIDDALPSVPPILGDAVYFLQDAAKENGMIFKSLSLSKASSNGTQANSSQASGLGDIKDVTLSVSILGDYKSLENFIISLEKSSRVLEVTSIAFGSGSSESGSASTSTGNLVQPQFQLQQIYTFTLQMKVHSY